MEGVVEEGKGRRVKFVVMEELTDDVLHNCTLETYFINQCHPNKFHKDSCPQSTGTRWLVLHIAE